MQRRRNPFPVDRQLCNVSRSVPFQEQIPPTQQDSKPLLGMEKGLYGNPTLGPGEGI